MNSIKTFVWSTNTSIVYNFLFIDKYIIDHNVWLYYVEVL